MIFLITSGINSIIDVADIGASLEAAIAAKL
jgi:hypothetical protein